MAIVPLILMLHAGQDLDQGGLACAVFAEQGMNLPLLQCEIHIFKGLDTRKGYVDALHRDDIVSSDVAMCSLGPDLANAIA